MALQEISRQRSINFVMWLLMVTLMQIYNEEEQAEEGKIQNEKFEEKRRTRKCNRAKTSARVDLKV